MTLYDAARCPYCARVRIALAEKAIEYEAVEIDLRDRPDWIYELNASGKVPVLDDGFLLPESAVIMEYLDDRYPEQRLLPRQRCKRRGLERELRPPPERRSQLETGNEDAGDHGNVCSTRTHVPLSRVFQTVMSQ